MFFPCKTVRRHRILTSLRDWTMFCTHYSPLSTLAFSTFFFFPQAARRHRLFRHAAEPDIPDSQGLSNVLENPVGSLAVSADTDTVATACADGYVRLFILANPPVPKVSMSSPIYLPTATRTHACESFGATKNIFFFLTQTTCRH